MSPKSVSVVFGGGLAALASLDRLGPPARTPTLEWQYTFAPTKKKVYITHIDSESALLTAIENTADSLSASNSFARESTAKFERYKTLSNVSSYLFITSMSPRASSSSSTGLQLQHNTASSISYKPRIVLQQKVLQNSNETKRYWLLYFTFLSHLWSHEQAVRRAPNFNRDTTLLRQSRIDRMLSWRT
jgi:hypothetical protein